MNDAPKPEQHICPECGMASPDPIRPCAEAALTDAREWLEDSPQAQGIIALGFGEEVAELLTAYAADHCRQSQEKIRQWREEATKLCGGTIEQLFANYIEAANIIGNRNERIAELERKLTNVLNLGVQENWDKLQTRVTELEKANENLLAGLKKFGRHQSACASNALRAWVNDISQVCACGFWEFEEAAPRRLIHGSTDQGVVYHRDSLAIQGAEKKLLIGEIEAHTATKARATELERQLAEALDILWREQDDLRDPRLSIVQVAAKAANAMHWRNRGLESTTELEQALLALLGCPSRPTFCNCDGHVLARAALVPPAKPEEP